MGLCFKCGEKYSPTHSCRDKHLQVYLVEFDADNGDKRANETGDIADDYFDAEDTTRMELSLNSFAGFEGNHTMKVRGELAGVVVIVLIDSGATHNFIAEHWLNQPGVKVEEIAEYTVTLGDGHSVKRKQRCRDLILNLQGINIVQTFYPFPLRGIDAVLGVEWLKTLGDVKVNWRHMTMAIGKKSSRVCLKGDPMLSRSQVSLQSIMRSVRKKGQGFLIECNSIKREDGTSHALTPQIQELLEKFPGVCQATETLPPRRARDHKIEIKPGEQPPNIRLYRYPHMQKKEIEELIKDMLQAGIIQTSTSPYSSPVILVKKKRWELALLC